MRIQSHGVRVEGRLRRVYDVEDFRADEKGIVRGTPAFIEREEKRVEANRLKHAAKSIVRELLRTHDALIADGYSLKERERRNGLALKYYEGQLNKED